MMSGVTRTPNNRLSLAAGLMSFGTNPLSVVMVSRQM